MRNVLKGLIIIALVTLITTIAIKEIKEYTRVREVKSSIENMIENKGTMIVVKEGIKNKATIKGDKIIISQDIENNEYTFTLNADHEDIVNAILMYTSGYNAFNTDIKDVEISFNN